MVDAGIHKFHLGRFKCQCGNEQSHTAADLQAAGIWAATPTAPKTFVHESLLVAWHQHKHHNPNASLSGFLIARDKLADDHGALQVGNGSSCLLDLISHARCQADLLAHAAMQGLEPQAPDCAGDVLGSRCSQPCCLAVRTCKQHWCHARSWQAQGHRPPCKFEPFLQGPPHLWMCGCPSELLSSWAVGPQIGCLQTWHPAMLLHRQATLRAAEMT